MDLKKEKIKKNIFFVLQTIFIVLTLFGAVLVIIKKVNNAGYAIIPMLWSLIFGMLYRNSKKAIEENTNKEVELN